MSVGWNLYDSTTFFFTEYIFPFFQQNDCTPQNVAHCQNTQSHVQFIIYFLFLSEQNIADIAS